MSPESSQSEEQLALVHQCRQGKPEAVAALRGQCQEALMGILLARGATRADAEDVLADLWAACIPGSEERPSLLEKYSGKTSLQGWLATVATHRWVDLKRRQARWVEINPEGSANEPRELRQEAWTAAPAEPEGALDNLLRDCLQVAFARCPAAAMVLLRLVYVHGLTQRELVRMLGWSESKVSRFMAEAMHRLEHDTMRELKRRDPLLELNWGDFVGLCAGSDTGFLYKKIAT